MRPSSSRLPAYRPELKSLDAFWPVLGAFLGRTAGEKVAVLTGLEGFASEDKLKALGAAAASFGAVGLFHLAGVTPEAATLDDALQGQPADAVIRLDAAQVREALGWLSTASGDHVDAVAIGSPHLSLDEMSSLNRMIGGRRLALPLYAHTGRHVLKELAATGVDKALSDAGVVLVADTCIVVTPILPARSGILLTNSGKFANYAPGNTGWPVLYGSLEECVETAVAGKLVRREETWS